MRSNEEIIKTDNIMNDTEGLKDMLRHMHSHIERLSIELEKHDKRLCELSYILLNDRDIKECDRVFNACIDHEDIDYQYSPIDEKDNEDRKRYIDNLPKYLENE